MLGLDIANWRAHDPASLAEGLKDGEFAIYFDCGEQDEYQFNDNAMYFHDRLAELGIQHHFESLPGHHDDDFFRERIKHSLRFHADNFAKAGIGG